MTLRTRNADHTRLAILRAAQHAFASHGYEASGVREITAAAGVNQALAIRYFGSKRQLFEEALDDLFDLDLLTADQSNFGRQLVAGFVGEDPGRINPLRILVHATGNAEAREIADRLLRARIYAPLADWFGGAEGHAKAACMLSLAAGFFLYRLLYPLAEWSGELDPFSRRWLEQSFQAIVDGDGTRPVHPETVAES